MATIKTSLSVTAPGGQQLTASMSRAASSTIDREIAVRGGEFVEVFTMDTEAGIDSTGASNSLADYRQLIAYNAGATPLEIALKTHLIDDSDGKTHAELYAYPTFFIPIGGYLSLPSPRIVSTSGTDTSAKGLNYVEDAGSRCLAQVSKRIIESTATYESKDGSILKYGLSDEGFTNSVGDIYISTLHGLDYADTPTGGKGNPGDLSAEDGIVPGTIRVMFYTPGFSEFNYTKAGLSPQLASSSSKLAVNSEYRFALTVDGASASDITFWTHTSDVTWGSPLTGTGVLYRIQAAMDAAEKECDVLLVGGKLRFQSRSRRTSAATVSSVLIGVPASGTDFRTSGINEIVYVNQHAVALADGSDGDIMFDNGEGGLSRANGGTGWCDYGLCGQGAGAGSDGLYITGAPANSSVQLSWLYGSIAGGNLSTKTPADVGGSNDETNSILAVYARALSYAEAHGANGRKGKLRLIVVDNEDYSQATY